MDKKTKKIVDTAIVNDGWGALLSGFQNTKANKQNMVFGNDRLMSDTELSSVYTTDGFGARVVNCIADDMTRKGFDIIGDVAGTCASELTRLDLSGHLNYAVAMSRLYGGSVVLIGVDDGQPLDRPVKVNTLRDIWYLKTYDRTQVQPKQGTKDTNPRSPTFGQTMIYHINDDNVPNGFDVHRSRLMVLPWVKGLNNQFRKDIDSYGEWGQPVLWSVVREVSNVGVLESTISNLVQEAVIGKYSLANVAEMLASGNTNLLLTRMQAINMSKSAINAVILDKSNDEEYTRDSLNFSGLNGVADTLMVFLSGVSGIPVTRLFGRSPAGLDASGESDLSIYYDMVASLQASMLTSEVQKLVFYINTYKDAIKVESPEDIQKLTTNGKNEGSPNLRSVRTVDEIHIKWRSLYQMTEKELADIYFTNTQADAIYMANGVLSSEEIRKNRLLGGYNPNMSVETAEMPVSSTTPVADVVEVV